MNEVLYTKTFNEWQQELDTELVKSAESFVKIGYLLKVARDTDILANTGYANVVEFAKARYGLDKTQVSRFIHINDRFSDTMYNGEEQKNKPTVEDTKTGATLVENVDYTLSYTAAVNAGTVEVTITGIGNYTGTAKTSYEIIKRNVTLTSATASKPYDKTPLTNKKAILAKW